MADDILREIGKIICSWADVGVARGCPPSPDDLGTLGVILTDWIEDREKAERTRRQEAEAQRDELAAWQREHRAAVCKVRAIEEERDALRESLRALVDAMDERLADPQCPLLHARAALAAGRDRDA